MTDTTLPFPLSGDVRAVDAAIPAKSRGDPAPSRFWNETVSAGSAPAPSPDAIRSDAADAERIAAALRDVKSRIHTDTTSLRLRVDGTSGSVQAEIVDAATDRVIRKIPSDELLRLSAAIRKGGSASIYDGTA